MDVAHPNRLEFDIFDARHSQQLGDAGACASQTPVVLDRQQNMRRPAAVGDEDRTLIGGFLGPAGILIPRMVSTKGEQG